MRQFIRRWLVAVLIFLALCVFVQKVTAQTATSGIQIEPVFQEVTVTQQASTSATVTLRNLSNTAYRLALEAIEIRQFNTNGEVVLNDRPLTSDKESKPTFIGLPLDTVELPAGGMVTIPFSVLNSIDLSPGGHYAALVARAQPASDAAKPQVVPALSTFVLVRKEGGENYNLSLIETSFGRKVVQWKWPEKIMLRFGNAGNTHVVPRGLVSLKTPWGSEIYRGIINESSLYVFPGSERELEVSLRPVGRVWPVMIVRWQVEGRTEPGAIRFFQNQWVLFIQPWILGILFCIVLLLVGIRKLRR